MEPPMDEKAIQHDQVHSKPRRSWKWLGCCLVPLALLGVWIVAQDGCARWELSRIVAVVDESELPGEVIFSGSRTDWVYNSNGRYMRKYWLIATNDPAEVRRYAEKLKERIAREDAKVELFDLGEFEAGVFAEGNWVDEVEHLVVLKIWRVRSEHLFEWT